MYCLSNFCCVCLGINAELLNLNKLDDDGVPIINKLIFIAFGHEKLDVDVTKSICSPCLKDLRIAYKFKTTCLTSNELLLGYNAQLKYFTGSVGLRSDLDVTISDQERVLSDKNPQEKVKKLANKKYKPRPLSKQKKVIIKQESTELKSSIGPRIKCKHCNEYFYTPMKRLIHFNKTHHKNLRKFRNPVAPEIPKCVCSMCQKSFLNAKFLKCHILKVHFNDSKRFCRHCKHHFSSRKCFIKHMKDRHNYNNFTCQICGMKYLKELNFNKHMTMHTENKISKTNKKKPKKQNKESKQSKKLKMITRYLVCNTCDEIFINSTQLKRHMLTHGKSSFSIDNTFENGPNDATDNSEILRQILTLPPAFNNDTLELNSEMSEHIEIYPEIKLEPVEPQVEIKEEIIDEIPSSSYNFDIQPRLTDISTTLHQTTDTYNNYNENYIHNPASTSHTSAVNNSDLQPRNETKNDEDSCTSSEIEINKYECNICNKKFTVKSFLNAHLLIHNNVSGPNFNCVQCKENFVDKKDFAQHILSNTCMALLPKQTFSCGICFKVFKYEFSLRQHMRTH